MSPQLNNVYESAPYLHDGKAATLEEIWTKYNDHDEHGVANDMMKDQLNDLVEYLKSIGDAENYKEDRKPIKPIFIQKNIRKMKKSMYRVTEPGFHCVILLPCFLSGFLRH